MAPGELGRIEMLIHHRNKGKKIPKTSREERVTRQTRKKKSKQYERKKARIATKKRRETHKNKKLGAQSSAVSKPDE